MIEVKPRHKFSNSTPPNSYYQILMHPSGKLNKTIELALFNEHRFCFYFWLKWNSRNENLQPTDLVSFDWHQDLVFPCEGLKSELEKLDFKNLYEVSLFSWTRLNSLNDDHILAAAYLDQINDIWIVCKQSHINNWKDEYLTDFKGKIHTIRKFPSKEELFENLKKSNVSNIYFDIDLDYFTIENSTSNDKHKFTYMTDNEIENIFSTENEFMKWVFERMNGFTIAIEPEHTGGFSKSSEYLKLLNSIFFHGELLHWDCKWKHLKNN